MYTNDVSYYGSGLYRRVEEELKEQTQPKSTRTDDRPDPEGVRGRCPECGDYLVSNCYYIKDRGYLIVWECWGSLRDEATCNYKRVL